MVARYAVVFFVVMGFIVVPFLAFELALLWPVPLSVWQSMA